MNISSILHYIPKRNKIFTVLEMKLSISYNINKYINKYTLYL
jgi:hypothetical protein